MIAEILYRDIDGNKRLMSFETEEDVSEFCYKRFKSEILYAVRYRGYLIYSNILGETLYDNLPVWHKLASFFS